MNLVYMIIIITSLVEWFVDHGSSVSWRWAKLFIFHVSGCVGWCRTSRVVNFIRSMGERNGSMSKQMPCSHATNQPIKQPSRASCKTGSQPKGALAPKHQTFKPSVDASERHATNQRSNQVAEQKIKQPSKPEASNQCIEPTNQPSKHG